MVFGVGHEVAHTLDRAPLVSRLNYSDRHTCYNSSQTPMKTNYLNEPESD